MIQVENEIGTPDGSRDARPSRQSLRGAGAEGTDGLFATAQGGSDSRVAPGVGAAGSKTSGIWEEAFGQGTATDEIFMAWSFARYVERVAEAGKAEYPLPMYVNAWVSGFPKVNERGNGQVGSPMPDTIDVWRPGHRRST